MKALALTKTAPTKCINNYTICNHCEPVRVVWSSVTLVNVRGSQLTCTLVVVVKRDRDVTRVSAKVCPQQEGVLLARLAVAGATRSKNAWTARAIGSDGALAEQAAGTSTRAVRPSCTDESCTDEYRPPPAPSCVGWCESQRRSDSQERWANHRDNTFSEPCSPHGA